MAEGENRDDIDLEDQVDGSENNPDNSEGGQGNYSEEDLKILKDLGIDLDKATTDDLIRVAKRAYKSEKRIVEEKKTKKDKDPEPQSNLSKDDLKKMLAEERFYEKNPEAEAYREKIEGFQAKGLSLEESYILASRKDKEVDENRNVYGKGFLKGNASDSGGVALITDEAFDSMTSAEQKDYTEKTTSKFGKIRFK